MQRKNEITDQAIAVIQENEIQLNHHVSISGGFATVKFGLWKNKPVAIKVQSKTARTDREIEIHQALHHSNIVLFLAVVYSSSHCWMILERMEMDLWSYLQSSHPTMQEKVRIAFEIASGLKYLHESALVLHRDLKTENILLRGDEVKIADLGLACYLSEEKKSHPKHVLGWHWAYAPEYIDAEKIYTKELDIYALAILLFELATQIDPYPYNNDQVPTVLSWIKNGMRPHLKTNTPMNQLIQQCWAQNPLERPDIYQVMEFLFLIQGTMKTEADENIKQNAQQGLEYDEEIPEEVMKSLNIK